MTNAEIIAKFPGYSTMDPNAIQPDFAATGGKGKEGSTSAPAAPSSSLSLTSGNLSSYLDNYQTNLLGSVAPANAPTAKTSYTTDELVTALVSKGYNETDARNAAENKGGRADELAKEYLGVGSAPATSSSQPTSFSDIKSQLTPTTDMPTPIDRTGTFNTLRTEMGVTDMETNLNELKAQQREIDAQLRTNKIAERGKPVAQGVIEGRISKESQQAQENYDFVSRQISSVTDQLNTAYNVINLTMSFQNLDYQDAVARYNTEFSQNLQVIDLVRGIQKDAITEQQRQIDNARANLTIYTNAITSGNLDPGSLSQDQKVQLAKLEAQSGLPIGFTSQLGLSAKDRIVSTSTNNGVTSVVLTDGQGNLTVKKVGTPTNSDAGTSTALKNLKADLANKMTLDQAVKKYGTLSPDLVYSTYNENSPLGKSNMSAADLKSKYNITTTATSSSATVGQDLKDAQAAIDAGASEVEVRRRFIEAHPDKASTYDDYIE